jgi:hypothetical protein
MTAWTDTVARLRIDLDDQDPAAYRWTDAELGQHISSALAELSTAIPDEATYTLTATPGSRDLSILTLNPRVRVAAVEYPISQYPPIYVPFSIWKDTLTMLIDDPPSTAAYVKVYYQRPHTISVASTLDEALLKILLDGAAGHAASQLASATTEAISIGGPNTDKDYAAMANRLLRDFRAALKRHGERGKLHARRLYAPAEPAATQDTDPGP